MNSKEVNIIAIGYAKRLLETGSRDRLRVRSYAGQFKSYHQIVFTKLGESQVLQHDENLTLYATNSIAKPVMIFDAYRTAQKIINKNPRERFVITVQDPFAAALIAFLLKGKHLSVQVQVHGDIFARHYFKRTFFSWPLRMWAVYVLKRADGIRVVSARIAASLKRRGIDESKVVVQPLQPRLDRFLEVGAQRLYSQDNSKPTTFIFVGRFTKEKNVFLLLKSFATLAKENTSAKLLLVGDGPLKPSIEKFIIESELKERVKIIEWTEDVAGVLGTADVLCLSSDHEGYALVLIEAMAAGMSVITTEVGCAGEVVQDGAEGIVVPVRDINRYTEAMRALLEPSLREQYGRKGYKTATLLIVSERVYLERLCSSLAALAH